MENKEILELSTSAWREKVYIETTEHIIQGYIYSKPLPVAAFEKFLESWDENNVST